MGFPSPAQDYVEQSISLDQRIITRPNEASDTSPPVFGVITYIINDARSGEFDDCPVM